MSLDRALEAVDEHFDHWQERLSELCRIPGVSSEPAPSTELQRSAELVVRIMEEAGLQNVRVLPVPHAHPYVYGEWLGRPGAPTLLLYAHHDVMPPGREDLWISPAFEPTVRDGRLFGRGVADDKAGIFTHVAAIKAWLDAQGSLPCNVKLLIDGEEETGSEHLEGFLRTHEQLLAADCILLTDTCNLDTGLPAVTTLLRGLVSVDVRIRGLDHPLHSGLWGGPVPDPVVALVKLLDGLTDEHGDVAIAGFFDDVAPLSEGQQAALDALPFDEADFRRSAGMLESGRLAGDPARHPYERLWWRPSLSINALRSVPLEGCSNQLTDVAEARVGIRLAPSQDPERCLALLVDALTTDPPFGIEVNVEPATSARGWSTEPVGPAFDAARRALKAGYGAECSFIGCGGTIPFVEPFTTVLGGIPAILLGLEDPPCNAHGENESLHLGDWRKGMRSQVRLFEELRLALAVPPTA